MRRARGVPARSRRGDAHLLRRAAWTVALQTALAVALVVLIVTAGSVLLFDRQQAEEVRDVLQHSATTADDVADPPVGVWLVQVRAPRGNAPGQRTVSAGTPQPAAQASVLDRASPGLLTIEASSQQWTAWVDLRATSRFVAIYDWRRHTSEEHRLLVAITTAGLVGIALAALIGGVVGQRAVRPLGEALALQRRFVADASHELRTPLAVVNTRAQLLRLQQSGADPQLSSELAQLVADTRVLGDVVTDLLTSAQLEHSPPLGEDIDVVALCEALIASMTPYASQHDVHLETQVLGQSPRLAYHVRGAPTALRRAVSALVDNAIAHSPVGEKVTVVVRRDDHSVCVDVRDNGDGLQPSTAAQLTQRFARGSSTGDGRRFGLGLALVDEVVRAHRGRLDIDSTLGVGSRFTLVMPATGP
ncbi:MAG TPA: HAMP domain-containing sensor histidine kinase [Dermatophilaceae bacterium]|nr:HAMP domain-containing sensor histidine kinase [Dermatophilaceae bacterium]